MYFLQYKNLQYTSCVYCIQYFIYTVHHAIVYIMCAIVYTYKNVHHLVSVRPSPGWQGVCEAVLHSDASGPLPDASLLSGTVLLCSRGFRDR